MNNRPKVSIVIPVYNGANYLREAIDSVLAQTYSNIEVIVVNDGSNDGGNTEAIALEYGEKIRYFCKENGGVASAINVGIKNMTGEWFVWLSHDDLLSANRIEEDINLMSVYPEARVTFCNVVLVDSKRHVIQECSYSLERVTNPREVLMLGGVNLCAMTIHRSCFNQTMLFNETNQTTQDVEFSLLLSKHYQYYHNNKAFLYSREHASRGTHVMRRQHRLDIEYLTKFIEEKFTLKDFFPRIDENNRYDLALAWEWMGNMYLGFEAYIYADRCYQNSFSLHKKILSPIFLKYILGAKYYESKTLKTMRDFLNKFRQ